ncbi:transcription factor bHLH100 isoform X2 [Cornus florida]|uniref:transcription factor bHLH100 isoform X2 n=1 Tax=Cornus florida TaxID=4283 RepID=UPI002899B103|nr:transcription factor bHLH100 isoform X2 [Cornus florida]
MLSLSPPLFSPFGWALEDNYNNHREAETTCESFLHFPSIQNNNIGSGESPIFGASGEDAAATMVKKINHNASERDRRKKINNLYSSLRLLLPPPDQTKKLSIPATVSRMLKYIPELQKELQRLVQKKEDLSSRIISSCRQLGENQSHPQALTKSSSSSVVSASQLGDTEVVIQISTTTTVKTNSNTPSFSEVLLNLEQNGLLLLDASVFQSFGDTRIFYNLHLQVQGTPKMELEMLRRKLLSFYEKRD